MPASWSAVGSPALEVFDLTQKVAETWLGSCNSVRRELLEILCTNRLADATNLGLTWRKPFDAVAETAKIEYGVPERTRTANIQNHNLAL